jgi:dimeric dUTPase (all-alpha-NTP-PPase superfamily)
MKYLAEQTTKPRIFARISVLRNHTPNLDIQIGMLAFRADFRHAAANFTAFAYHGTDDPLDTESIMEEFLRLLEFYDSRHRGEARPMTALERLVEQVKND